jgi:hypothetical protein
MDAWRIVVVAIALGLVLAIAGCKQQPEGQAADHGLCFQQAGCSGGGVGQLPTQSQCKAAGGKSWLGGAQQYCTSF